MATAVVKKHKVKQFTFQTEAAKTDKEWYEWKVELAGSESALSEVKEVEYILHPTFTNRIQRCTDPKTHFALEREGWGEFDIHVNLTLKNGAEVSGVVPLKFE